MVAVLDAAAGLPALSPPAPACRYANTVAYERSLKALDMFARVPETDSGGPSLHELWRLLSGALPTGKFQGAGQHWIPHHPSSGKCQPAVPLPWVTQARGGEYVEKMEGFKGRCIPSWEGAGLQCVEVPCDHQPFPPLLPAVN